MDLHDSDGDYRHHETNNKCDVMHVNSRVDEAATDDPTDDVNLQESSSDLAKEVPR